MLNHDFFVHLTPYSEKWVALHQSRCWSVWFALNVFQFCYMVLRRVHCSRARNTRLNSLWCGFSCDFFVLDLQLLSMSVILILVFCLLKVNCAFALLDFCSSLQRKKTVCVNYLHKMHFISLMKFLCKPVIYRCKLHVNWPILYINNFIMRCNFSYHIVKFT